MLGRWSIRDRILLLGVCGLGATLLLTTTILPGYKRLEELRARESQLEQEVQLLESENQRLRQSIVGLREDPWVIERTLRHRLGIRLPEEIPASDVTKLGTSADASPSSDSSR